MGDPSVDHVCRTDPGMDGVEVCRTVKSNPVTQAIPIIMITAKSEESDESSRLAEMKHGLQLVKIYDRITVSELDEMLMLYKCSRTGKKLDKFYRVFEEANERGGDLLRMLEKKIE